MDVLGTIQSYLSTGTIIIMQIDKTTLTSLLTEITTLRVEVYDLSIRKDKKEERLARLERKRSVFMEDLDDRGLITHTQLGSTWVDTGESVWPAIPEPTIQ